MEPAGGIGTWWWVEAKISLKPVTLAPALDASLRPGLGYSLLVQDHTPSPRKQSTDNENKSQSRPLTQKLLRSGWDFSISYLSLNDYSGISKRPYLIIQRQSMDFSSLVGNGLKSPLCFSPCILTQDQQKCTNCTLYNCTDMYQVENLRLCMVAVKSGDELTC